MQSELRQTPKAHSICERGMRVQQVCVRPQARGGLPPGASWWGLGESEVQQSPETNKECVLPWAALICSVTIHSNGPKTQDLSHQVHSCISPPSGLNLISHMTWEKSLDFFGFPFLIYLVKLKYQYKPCLLNSCDGDQATAKTSLAWGQSLAPVPRLQHGVLTAASRGWGSRGPAPGRTQCGCPPGPRRPRRPPTRCWCTSSPRRPPPGRCCSCPPCSTRWCRYLDKGSERKRTALRAPSWAKIEETLNCPRVLWMHHKVLLIHSRGWFLLREAALASPGVHEE